MSLRKNVIWNLAEALLTSAVLFLLYRAILGQLGVAAMGIWALVVSSTAIGRVGDMGVSGGLARYVAIKKHAPSADTTPTQATKTYVETGLILNLLLYACLAAAIYVPAWFAIGAATTGNATREARHLLPYAVGAFAFQNVSSVLTSALIGYERSDQKSKLMLISISIQFIVAMLLIHAQGLVGLAIAQIVQYLIVTVVGWILVCRADSETPKYSFPYKLNRTATRDLFGFGVRLQALTLATAFYEPAVKFMLSSALGLQFLGMYELVTRTILQVRGLVIAPCQNLTPMLAKAIHNGKADLIGLYSSATAIMCTVGFLSMATLCISAPLISMIWLGHIDHLLMSLLTVAAAGWFVNIFGVPGYYLGIAGGVLRWNIMGGLATTILSPILGALIAKAFGGQGAVIGIMLGVAGGAGTTAMLNARTFGLQTFPSGTSLRNAVAQIFHNVRAILLPNAKPIS